MKKYLVFLVFMVLCGSVSAMTLTSVSGITSQVTVINSPCMIYRITFCNSDATPNTVDLSDSGTDKGFLVIPAKKSKPFLIEGRITNNLRISGSSAGVRMMIESTYQAGRGNVAQGHYWYALSNQTNTSTLYASNMVLLRAIVSNFNADTGHCAVLYDGTAKKISLQEDSYNSDEFDFNAVAFSTSAVAQCESSSMSVIIFRKE